MTPHGPRGRIRGDPLLPHHSGEVLPPLPQHGLIDVETPSVDALGLDDQVHVGVSLMRVQCHGIPVLGPELLPREGLCRRQYRRRRRRCRHRQRDVVHQLDAGRRDAFTTRLPVLAARELQMPAPKELLLALPEHVLPIVRLEVEFPVLADVGKVCRDGADPPSPAGHLDHDFRRPAHDRALDLLDLCCREATRLRRTRPSAAKQVQEGAISRRHAKGTPTQSGSPRP